MLLLKSPILLTRMIRVSVTDIDSPSSLIVPRTITVSSIYSNRDRTLSSVTFVDLVDNYRSIFDTQNMGWSLQKEMPCPLAVWSPTISPPFANGGAHFSLRDIRPVHRFPVTTPSMAQFRSDRVGTSEIPHIRSGW
jgi:hypothetical protein